MRTVTFYLLEFKGLGFYTEEQPHSYYHSFHPDQTKAKRFVKEKNAINFGAKLSQIVPDSHDLRRIENRQAIGGLNINNYQRLNNTFYRIITIVVVEGQSEWYRESPLRKEKTPEELHALNAADLDYAIEHRRWSSNY